MSYKDEKPVGSEFPPPPSKDENKVGNFGAETVPLNTSSSPQPPAPPVYSAGSFGNMSSSISPQTPYSSQTPYSIQTPYSSQTQYSQSFSPQQNAYQLNERSLPPPPSQSSYTQPQQPQQPQQQQQTFYQQPGQPGVYAMQPQMQSQMQPQQVHVINLGAPLSGPQIVSHSPVRVICPGCGNEVITNMSETPGNTAFLWALVLFCVFFPLMWLPCVLPGCLDKIHTCPACGYLIAYVKV